MPGMRYRANDLTGTANHVVAERPVELQDERY
jgi:hypothetical protein